MLNPTSTLDDGTAEVQTSNRWTDLNPETGERGEWLQVTGADGSVTSPVVSAQWGKYLKFFVKDTKKFTVYATGSASGSAEEGNYVLVTAKPFNNSNAIVAQTEPGTIYGKGTASDCVTVELDPTEKYEIWVQGAPEVNRDIMITAVTLQDEATAEAQEAGKGTLNIAIANAKEDSDLGIYTVDLVEGKTYTLKGEAPIGLKALVINGNNATVTDGTGQITARIGGLALTGVNFDCATSTVAPIAMSEEPDESLYTYSEETTTAEDGTETVVGTYKYEGANQKVYEASNIIILKSNFANLPARSSTAELSLGSPHLLLSESSSCRTTMPRARPSSVGTMVPTASKTSKLITRPSTTPTRPRATTSSASLMLPTLLVTRFGALKMQL